METIYKTIKNEYYIYKSGIYMQCDIMLKRNTIVVIPNGEFKADIDIEKEYTFIELKKELLSK